MMIILMEMILKPILHIRLMVSYYIYKQRKACKKAISKEVVPGTWHPTRLSDWRMPHDEKKETNPYLFNEKVAS